MRKDKAKNIAKVAKEIINNPIATQREIAENADVGLGTANRIISELEQTGTKDDRIIGITDKDLENIIEMQRVVSMKIRDSDEMSKTRIGELAQAMREATARYSLFRGSATDEQGGLKQPTAINIISPV